MCHRFLGKCCQGDRLGIVTNVSVLEGTTVPLVISQAAARLATDLVVMATHDRDAFQRVLHGSATLAVLHQSDVPALVIHT